MRLGSHVHRYASGGFNEWHGEVEQKIERAGERLNETIDEFQRDSEKP